MKSDQCKIWLPNCPLCQERNENTLPMRPPTAGVRVLELAGPACTKEQMFLFLKQLQFTIGLPLSLREHFDMVIGLDVGESRRSFTRTRQDELTNVRLILCANHFLGRMDPR